MKRVINERARKSIEVEGGKRRVTETHEVVADEVRDGLRVGSAAAAANVNTIADSGDLVADAIGNVLA
jgi:hypothetical protein